MREPDTADESSLAHFQEKFRSSLETDLADPNWHTLVISAENLSLFDSKAVARFLKWLTEYVSDISVVAYVRHPVDWSRSMVQQRLKVGLTLGQIYKNMPLPEWRQRLTPWLDAIGLERFRLVSFDDARENIGIMASFCDAAGLPREKILSLVSPVHANESMSLEAALLLDSLNRLRPLRIDGQLSPERRQYGGRYGIGAMVSVPGNRFCLSAEHAEKVRADSRPDLEWLNTTFGKNLFPDIFSDAPIETPIRPNTMPQETVDALAIKISDLLSKQSQLLDKQAQVKNLQRELRHQTRLVENLKGELKHPLRTWWKRVVRRLRKARQIYGQGTK